jgi:hypothetical protein
MYFVVIKPIIKIFYYFKIKFNKLVGKQVIHFIHIGKTGGTSIKNAFNGKYVFICKKCVICLHNHNTTLHNIPKGEKVFFVVRDPLSRFVSGFYSRWRMGKPRLYVPWREGEQKAFNEFDTPNQLGEALSNKNIEQRNKAIEAMQSIGHVRTSYWNWFKDDKYLKERVDDIAFVLKQENLNEDFEAFKKKFLIPDNIRIPKNEVKSHKNPSHLDKDLSDTAKGNLKKWYLSDYRFISILKEENLLNN